MTPVSGLLRSDRAFRDRRYQPRLSRLDLLASSGHLAVNERDIWVMSVEYARRNPYRMNTENWGG